MTPRITPAEAINFSVNAQERLAFDFDPISILDALIRENAAEGSRFAFLLLPDSDNKAKMAKMNDAAKDFKARGFGAYVGGNSITVSW